MIAKLKGMITKLKGRGIFKWGFYGYLAYNVLQITVLLYFYSPSELWQMYIALIKAA